MEAIKAGNDTLFILLGAIMVLAMHAGFAFLELGTVRKKNQVNALVKILVDFGVSTIAYFFIGYWIAYGVHFFAGAETLAQKNGYELVKFFFLLTFAAAIPAIVSGGIAERARFNPQLDRHVPAGRLRLSVLRGHRLEPALRRAGVDEVRFRRGVPRLRGQRRRPRDGRLDRPGRGAAAGRAARPLHQGRGDFRAPAVVDPVPGARGVDPHRRLVRLQRDVGADAGEDFGPGRRQLAAGDGGRHAGRTGRRSQRPGLRPQRPARGPGGRVRGFRRDASAGRAGHRRGRRRRCSSCCSR